MNNAEKERMRALTGPLSKWYTENRRELPWRSEATPYRVWISEIMLQQTRIETVKGYFERFVNTLPDLSSLAEADEDTVLKLWEGLGYYSRARNLQKAAKRCMECFHGALPETYEELLSLPGIGPYTAGAIGSIAMRLPVAAVDGNVLRVVTRILADPADIAQPAVKKRFEALLTDVIPKDSPGVFNQALMELGERICLPAGEPDCENCPVRPFCLAYEAGTQMQFPVKSAKKARRKEEKTVLVISCGSRFAIRKRPDQGLLAGLYEFPGLPGRLGRREIAEWAAAQTDRFEIRPLGEARHIFTHIEWNMVGYRIDSPEEWGTDWFFAEREEILERFSLPSAFRVYAAELKKRAQKGTDIRDTGDRS